MNIKSIAKKIGEWLLAATIGVGAVHAAGLTPATTCTPQSAPTTQTSQPFCKDDSTTQLPDGRTYIRYSCLFDDGTMTGQAWNDAITYDSTPTPATLLIDEQARATAEQDAINQASQQVSPDAQIP